MALSGTWNYRRILSWPTLWVKTSLPSQSARRVAFLSFWSASQAAPRLSPCQLSVQTYVVRSHLGESNLQVQYCDRLKISFLGFFYSVSPIPNFTLCENLGAKTLKNWPGTWARKECFCIRLFMLIYSRIHVGFVFLNAFYLVSVLSSETQLSTRLWRQFDTNAHAHPHQRKSRKFSSMLRRCRKAMTSTIRIACHVRTHGVSPPIGNRLQAHSHAGWLFLCVCVKWKTID